MQHRVQSDNVGALRLLLNLATKSDALSQIGKELALDMAAGNYSIGELEHIPGLTNVAPDALSRLWAPEPKEFPSLGDAVQDGVPALDETFWRAG